METLPGLHTTICKQSSQTYNEGKLPLILGLFPFVYLNFLAKLFIVFGRDLFLSTPSQAEYNGELCHGKTGRKIFLVVTPKEGLTGTSPTKPTFGMTLSTKYNLLR